MKRCPSCATLYPDATSFCESDGEVLSPMSIAPSAASSRRTAQLMATMPVAPPPADVEMLDDGERLSDALGRTSSRDRMREVLTGALDIAAKFERDRLAWQPQPEDFVVGTSGALALSQARGVCKRSGVFDARTVLLSLGEALAPVPLVFCDIGVVRCLIAPRPEPLTLDAAREELERAFAAGPALGAAALDVGFSRARQEDCAFASALDAAIRVAVLCDGVSLSADGGLAARVGAKTAFEHVRAKVVASSDDATTAREAIRNAHEAVCAAVSADAEIPSDVDPPGSTIVVAIVRDGVVTVGWLGDSRAYVVGDSGSVMLTRDHSWRNEVERLGYTGDTSAMGNLGNALTRCIGPLEAGMRSDVEPEVATHALGPGQTLIVCSDGLSAYFPDAPLMGKLVAFHEDARADELATRLVNHALVAGGEDNVSVVAFRG